MSTFLLLPAAIFAMATAPGARSVGPAVFHSATPKAVASPRAVPSLPASARHDLGPLTDSERASLSESGGKGRSKGSYRVGIVRPLPAPVAIREGFAERSVSGRSIWTASFASDGARGVRLHVAAAGLPEGSRAWVYGEGGSEVHGPYTAASLERTGGFWTNAVFSDRVYLEVELAGSPAPPRLQVDSLGHIERGHSTSAKATAVDACPLDLSCVTEAEFPGKNDASLATAMVEFESGRFLIQCTAGLINTTAGPIAPYLLTANHCVSEPSEAASLEAFWRYKTPSCGALPPDPATFPRTLGATLLATESASAGSDFTLLQLNEDPPDGSIYLGWSLDTPPNGETLHRVSHPEGAPQSYSENTVEPREADCTELAAGQAVSSEISRGMTLGGSSGGPLYTGDLEIVGQLWGGCGSCGDTPPQTQDSDGAFEQSYSSLQQYLDPEAPGSCVANATTLCLNGGRFRVTVRWTKNTGETGAGQGVPLTSDSGYFWFFNSANIELVVKVLGACSVNNHFWVFAGGLTNVQVVLTVVDTTTGAQQVYTNPQGTAYQPLQDTSAFNCP